MIHGIPGIPHVSCDGGLKIIYYMDIPLRTTFIISISYHRYKDTQCQIPYPGANHLRQSKRTLQAGQAGLSWQAQ